MSSLLDEVTAGLDVSQKIRIRVILNTDSLIEEEVREQVLHPEGHVEDVRHLRASITRSGSSSFSC